MREWGLIATALLLFITGWMMIYRSFKHTKSSALLGAVGVLILLFSGNVIIYLYASLHTPKRVVDELYKKKLPELGLLIKSQPKLEQELFEDRTIESP